MEANSYWELFCATGAPVAYMLYRNAEQNRGEQISKM